MGTSKMEQNKDDIIKSLKEKVKQQQETMDLYFNAWSDTADRKDELWKEKFELEDKNEQLRSKVKYLEKVAELLANKTMKNEMLHEFGKKRYNRLKRLNRKNSN